MTRLTLRRQPDPDASVPAEQARDVCITPNEFFLPGKAERARTGVLLIHGLTGTPNEMRMLGKGIHRAGFSVYGMQLAGHCGSTDDLVRSRWQDWAGEQATREADGLTFDHAASDSSVISQ